ncbi:uncharacterized protein LOC142923822, partial [Petromyzon marinus]|uniref:uncharacterized protein LOC142923822 n=1 Tax=Petromyzon marinus TaxID=7757 RepID=UPI003F72B6A6
MYLYYLLGWKIYRKIHTVKKDEQEEWVERKKRNTYVLALDGDTDFYPSALSMLVDRLTRDSTVGAACGRIHPTGVGRHDLVWQRHQKMQVMFENVLPQGYAITQRCSLDQEEDEFWKSMISDYLKPLEEDDDHRKRVKQELFEIRNKGTFVYFMINALWLVATLALQFVGADLYIQIPSTKNEGTVIDVLPLAFMFLITFSSMLIVQFLAMLYH